MSTSFPRSESKLPSGVHLHLVGLVFMSITGLLCNRVLSSLTHLQTWQMDHKVHPLCWVWPENPFPCLHQRTAHAHYGGSCHSGDAHGACWPTILSLAQGRSYKGFGFSNRHCTIPWPLQIQNDPSIEQGWAQPQVSLENCPQTSNPQSTVHAPLVKFPPCQADSNLKASCNNCDKEPELWRYPQFNSSVFNPP